VGDSTCVTPSGNASDQPGPVTTYSWASPPVAREPATKNTSLNPLSIGMMYNRSPMPGMLNTHGPDDTSSQTIVYKVSALGAAAPRSSTAG